MLEADSGPNPFKIHDSYMRCALTLLAMGIQLNSRNFLFVAVPCQVKRGGV